MWWSLACAAPEPADSGEPAVAWEPTEFAPVEAEWSVDEAVAVIEAVAAEPAVDVEDLADTWLALLAAGDSDCPGSDTQLQLPSLTGCTASTGYRYTGQATFTEMETGAWLLSGDFTVEGPDGRVFYGGGAANDGASGTGWSSNVHGSFGWEGDTGWLGDGISGWWDGAGGDDGAPWVELDGGLTWGSDTFWFTTLRREPSTCDGLTGTLALRDPSGGWWKIGRAHV